MKSRPTYRISQLAGSVCRKSRLSKDQNGNSSTMVLLLVALSIILVAAMGFGVWAFMGRSDYKNNSDQKAAVAVAAAEESQRVKLEKEFAEKEKSPARTYRGPATYGSITFDYPKTWSGQVDDSGRGSQVMDGYFYPNIVPGINTTTSYALRLQLEQTSYDQVANQYQSLVKAGKLRATAYVPPKMQDKGIVAGLKLEGEIATKKQGVLVLLKVRDKTLKISTEADQFKGDFDTFVLASLTFSP